MSLKGRVLVQVSAAVACASASSALAQSALTPTTWYQRAPQLVTQPIPKLQELDAPAVFVLVSDSVAVWFNRDDAQVVRVDLKSGDTRRFGRNGSGPMEYSNGGELKQWIGDSVLVRDFPQMRATVLSTTSGQGRQFKYASLDSVSGSQIAALMDGGVVAVQPMNTRSQIGPDGLFFDTITIRLLRNGRSVREPLRYAVDGGVRLKTEKGVLLAAGPVSQNVDAFIDMHRVVWFSADSMHVWRVNGTIRDTPLRLPAHIHSPAERRSILDRWIREGRFSPQMATDLRRTVRIPDRSSAVSRLYSGQSDRLWVRIEQRLGQTEGVSVVEFNEAGQIGRCFRLAPNQRLLGLGANIAITGERSDDDTYRVNRGTIPATCPVKGKFY